MSTAASMRPVEILDQFVRIQFISCPLQLLGGRNQNVTCAPQLYSLSAWNGGIFTLRVTKKAVRPRYHDP